MGVAQNSTIGGANRRFWSMFSLTRATHLGIPVFGATAKCVLGFSFEPPEGVDALLRPIPLIDIVPVAGGQEVVVALQLRPCSTD